MKAQVVLATHAPRHDLLARQIASVREQTVSDWQCLILDDASPDRTVVARAVAGDERFRLLPAQPHLGPYRAFERLLSQAPADVPVFLCDQDDRWWPQKMQVLLDAGGTAFCAMRVVRPDGSLVRSRFLPRAPDAQALSPAGLLLMNSVSGTALVISQRVRTAALPFPAPQARGWHDQWLAAVAARLGELQFVDEVLVDYTQHSQQVAGDGLRRLSPTQIGSFLQRLSAAPVQDLRSRTAWVIEAARRLLELPGPEDPALAALAAGRFGRQAARGVRSGRVPVARAALLLAGASLGAVRQTNSPS